MRQVGLFCALLFVGCGSPSNDVPGEPGSGGDGTASAAGSGGSDAGRNNLAGGSVAGTKGGAAGSTGGGGRAGQDAAPGVGGSTSGGGSTADSGPTPPVCGISNSDPAPPSDWVNATGNLAGMASQCGNLSLVSAKPCSKTIITGVGGNGLFWTENGGELWSSLGTGLGSDPLDHRIASVVYDPTNPDTFWESGYYGSHGGVYTTSDGGTTLHQLGTISHNDSVSVDLADPGHRTLLAGGHEQPLKLWLSTDGGQTFTDIGAALNSGTAACTSTLVIDSKTFLVGCNGSGPVGIYRSSDGGATFTRIVDNAVNVQPLWASDGTIYWTIEKGGVYTSTDLGQHFTLRGNATVAVGVSAPTSMAELPDGRVVVLGADHLQITSDKGVTWTPIGKPLPFRSGGSGGLSGVTYSALTKTFFVWHRDCNNVVPADAIWRAGFE